MFEAKSHMIFAGPSLFGNLFVQCPGVYFFQKPVRHGDPITLSEDGFMELKYESVWEVMKDTHKPKHSLTIWPYDDDASPFYCIDEQLVHK